MTKKPRSPDALPRRFSPAAATSWQRRPRRRAPSPARRSPRPRQRADAPIKWRLQTYSGAPLGAHVIKPQIDAFNAAANGEMEIELYYADQLVPTAELFRALQNGTSTPCSRTRPPWPRRSTSRCSAATSRSPPATASMCRRCSTYYGLNEIWEEAYAEVDNVTWLSAGAWDPLHIFTKKPIRSLADMNGKRVFGVPTAGKFLSRYGLVPVTVPWDNVEVAMQTGELDGVAWCGFTEAYEVGWADVCKYALDQLRDRRLVRLLLRQHRSWNKVPPHLQQLFRTTIDQSHYYRDVWYWGGEAKLRVEGKKMELTSLPPEEWAQVITDCQAFWDEVAASQPARRHASSRLQEIRRDHGKGRLPLSLIGQVTVRERLQWGRSFSITDVLSF